jgi:heme exporter protein A
VAQETITTSIGASKLLTAKLPTPCYTRAVSTPPPALEAKHLARGYGDRWALCGLNLQLPSGKSLLLAGPNGAGKTTMLRLLATTLRPSEGELRVFGIDPKTDAMAARQHIALLSHRTQLYNELTGAENLSVTANLLGLPRDKGRAPALLARVGLEGRGDDRVRTYSAGMRKRLAFARLLLQDPQIVLLDEPYGQLDPAGFSFVDELVQQFIAEGRTLVMSTHLLERACGLLRAGLILHGGRMVWVGAAAELPAAYVESTRS